MRPVSREVVCGERLALVIGWVFMIDLHVHTTNSDGSLSPESVVQYAVELGLQAIAVTDHDTVGGVRRAREEGGRLGLEVVPGVEISARWNSGILHILGYFVRTDDPDLLRALEFLTRARKERVPKILSKLEDCSVYITTDEVRTEAVGGVPGRPHLASIMVRKGYVSYHQQAFDRYLKKGAAAYVEKVKLPPSEAIDVITKAGGLPVLAHPYSLGLEESERLEETVRHLMSYGLRGIEAYYSKHTPAQTRTYLDLAERLGLAVTGGSDFHGASKPGVKLGVIPGFGSLPYRMLQTLKKFAEARTSLTPGLSHEPSIRNDGTSS